MEIVIITVYIIGYFIAVGYQFMAIEYHNPNHGILNRICGSIILGILSWIVIGVVVYKVYNEKSYGSITKEEER